MQMQRLKPPGLVFVNDPRGALPGWKPNTGHGGPAIKVMVVDDPGFGSVSYASLVVVVGGGGGVRGRGKLSKKITRRAMRRTFQDLARQAEVRDIVTRAISGHATETMQHHYSMVNAKEVEESIGKVISLSRARDLLEVRKSTEGTSGAESGAKPLESTVQG